MGPREGRHSDVLIRIAEGRKSSFAKAKNRTLSWGTLIRELRQPTRTGETFKAYLSLPTDEKTALKNVNGWILGGPVDGDRRRKSLIPERDIITFDMDDATPEQLDDLKRGMTRIADLEWCAHTTRSHTTQAPRIRIFFLLKDPVPAEQYSAAARILAHRLDDTMDSIDQVSFRLAQMMFKPSASKNGEFEFIHNEGKRLDVPVMLEEFGNWQDWTQLPYSARQGQRRPSQEKAEDPRSKRGILGAFCRAWSVEAAMEEFIPGTYSPGDSSGSKPRYNYNFGSGANGMVVEDDGLFIYSHHGTDPCGERLCNAWDMVRLHRFGELDKAGDERELPPTKLASYKAMVELATEDPATRAQQVEDNYDLTAMFEDLSEQDDVSEDAHYRTEIDDEIDDLLAPARPTAGDKPRPDPRPAPKRPKKGWAAEDLETDAQGNVLETLHNIATIVHSDPRLWGVVARNEFTNQVSARRTLKAKLANIPPIVVEDPENGLPWSDVHDISIRALLEAPNGQGLPGWGFKNVTDRNINGAVILAAERHKYHPVKDHWESLTWDGVSRVETLFIDYLGCRDHPYYRETALLLLLAAVARIYCPGHKFDFAPILSGAQGIRKSTFIKELFGESWFGELTAHMASGKDTVEQMLGMLGIELPELASMRKTESEDVKHFMSLTKDKVRLSYDRRMSVFHRQCVFMGTTNAKHFLKDPTGNRRWWPIRVTVAEIDTEELARQRDQIWAEANALYWEMRVKYARNRLPLYLRDPESQRLAKELQEGAREESSEEGVAGQIEHWLNKPRPLSQFNGDLAHEDFAAPEEPRVIPIEVCLPQIFCEALGGDMARYTANRTLAHAVGSAMAEVEGWVKAGSRKRVSAYGFQRVWVRADVTPEEILKGYRVVDDGDPEDVL